MRDDGHIATKGRDNNDNIINELYYRVLNTENKTHTSGESIFKTAVSVKLYPIGSKVYST